MNRKAYFFLMDGIFSIVILIIGFLVISSSKVDLNEEMPLNVVTQNTVDLFSSVKFNDLCASCNCSIAKVRQYCVDSYVLNTDESLLDVMGELYARNQIARAGELFENITLEKNLFNKEMFGVEFKIGDTVIYTNGDGKSKSRHVISAKKIIFGYYESADFMTANYWGPYMAEVNAWEK